MKQCVVLSSLFVTCKRLQAIDYWREHAQDLFRGDPEGREERIFTYERGE
jgi:hypothetical protein